MALGPQGPQLLMPVVDQAPYDPAGPNCCCWCGVFMIGLMGSVHAMFAVTYLTDITHAISAEYVQRNCTVESFTVQQIEALDCTYNWDFISAAFRHDGLPRVIVKVGGVGSPVAAYKYTEAFSNSVTASYSPSPRAWAQSFTPGSNVACWQNNAAFVEGSPKILGEVPKCPWVQNALGWCKVVKENTYTEVVKLSAGNGMNFWVFWLLTKLFVFSLVCILIALRCAYEEIRMSKICEPCYAGHSESDSETDSMIDIEDPSDEE